MNGVLVAPDSPSSPIALAFGNNRITLDIVSRDSSETTAYVLDVQRPRPDTAALAAFSLFPRARSPRRSHPGVFAYKAVIPFGVSDFTLTARPSRPSHIVLMGSTVLERNLPSLPTRNPRTENHHGVRPHGDDRPHPGGRVHPSTLRPPDPSHDPSDASIAASSMIRPAPISFPSGTLPGRSANWTGGTASSTSRSLWAIPGLRSHSTRSPMRAARPGEPGYPTARPRS